MQLIISPWNNPTLNCTLEKYLVTECFDDILLLYINQPSVIVGRNQTIESEVDVDYCLQKNIPIVRRFSGGGTVYHDWGNINYAFISNKGDTPILDSDFSSPIIDALAALGVIAEVGHRRELLCKGLKISGTASHITRNRQLFHGTLLHKTNLEELKRTLQGNATQRGKGVASIPSLTCNISTYTGTHESTCDFLQRLAQQLCQQYGLDQIETLSDEQQQAILALEWNEQNEQKHT